MNTPITSSGYQYYIIQGNKSYDSKSDYQSVSIMHSFKPWVTDFTDTELKMVALNISELTMKYFRSKSSSENVRAAKLENKLCRLCYIRQDDQNIVKTLYVSRSCQLQENITHVLLDYLSKNYFPVKIVTLSTSQEKKLLNDLENKLNPQGSCILF